MFFDGVFGFLVFVLCDGFCVVKVVDVFATSVDGGVFVVTDVVGNFKFWCVCLENLKILFIVELIMNIVIWNGFGGVCFVCLARLSMAFDSF